MAIIYSYPINTNILATDIIVGSSTAIVNGRRKNQTKSFEIADLTNYIASVLVPPGSYVPYIGAIQEVNLGAFNLTVNNISVGKGAGTGTNNTALGEQALSLNTVGTRNTAIGRSALKNNTTGGWNTAIGSQTQEFGQTALGNVSLGYAALQTNVIGNFNTVVGYKTLFNSKSDKNTAIGAETMFVNQTGTFNTVVGQEALRASVAGSFNSIVGCFAILNAEASYVAALGRDAGRFSSAGNLLTASESIFIGYNSKSLNTSSTNEIVIGANAVGEGNNTVTIGHTTITSTRLRGAVKGGSFVKDGGTNVQYLMADGSVTTSAGGSQNLQDVTAQGADTTIPIRILASTNGNSLEVYNFDDTPSPTSSAIFGIGHLVGVYGYSYADKGVFGFAESPTGIGISGYAEDGVAAEFETDSTSGANIVNFKKSGVLKAFINNAGELTAQKLIKEGGTSSEYLMADGSVTTGGGGSQNLQQVTDIGASTTNTITITPPVGEYGIFVTTGADTGIYSLTTDGTSVYGSDLGTGVGLHGASVDGIGVLGYTMDGFAISATCDNAGGGGALSIDGGTGVGVGAVIQNGGVNIQGLVNSLTGYQLKLSQDSAAKPTTSAWTITSDARVKTNVNPYTKGLEAILSINPITYDYNGKAGFEKLTGNIGIIAQDILNIMPECINTYKAKLNEDDEESTELYNFNSHALTFALINAIKELKAEIEILKTK